MASDLEIARSAAKLRPIGVIAARLGIEPDALHPYGRFIAKLDAPFIDGLQDRPDGKPILVTAISPTPAGEGKTTTTVGLGDGLNRIGRKAMIALREPSLGPCFGQKGGGGRRALAGRAHGADQSAFHGRFPRDHIGAQPARRDDRQSCRLGNAIGIDASGIPGGVHRHERPVLARDRQFARGRRRQRLPARGRFRHHRRLGGDGGVRLAGDLADLEARLGRIIVARGHESAVTAADLKAAGAMTVLLKDALQPNLVADDRGQSGLRAWRPFRQYRPWLQIR
jgi:formate--tetrahydrofolate ligase